MACRPIREQPIPTTSPRSTHIEAYRVSPKSSRYHQDEPAKIFLFHSVLVFRVTAPLRSRMTQSSIRGLLWDGTEMWGWKVKPSATIQVQKSIYLHFPTRQMSLEVLNLSTGLLHIIPTQRCRLSKNYWLASLVTIRSWFNMSGRSRLMISGQRYG